eukprot:CAMPEP_0182427670 /NCGR_PEP_ID=MMETSP1167-20130531/18968_1 /TAXON_ID=2988 /ORGANISM="Mallomonas Sp, Strain CCMP3275" /LENGTH=97 /DNA_ID=CAMNT_0024610075 /DNA_START=95 /DNA_END=388 /DNA_ORIENTATION=-
MAQALIATLQSGPDNAIIAMDTMIEIYSSLLERLSEQQIELDSYRRDDIKEIQNVTRICTEINDIYISIKNLEQLIDNIEKRVGLISNRLERFEEED